MARFSACGVVRRRVVDPPHSLIARRIPVHLLARAILAHAVGDDHLQPVPWILRRQHRIEAPVDRVRFVAARDDHGNQGGIIAPAFQIQPRSGCQASGARTFLGRQAKASTPTGIITPSIRKPL